MGLHHCVCDLPLLLPVEIWHGLFLIDIHYASTDRVCMCVRMLNNACILPGCVYLRPWCVDIMGPISTALLVRLGKLRDLMSFACGCLHYFIGVE